MDQMTKQKVMAEVDAKKLIAIVRGVEREKLVPLAQALYDGGIRLLEVTYSANKSVSDEETADRIRMLAEEFKGKLYVGAGTVLTKEQVKLTHKAGGQFIISPNVSKSVIKTTAKLGMVSMPGALTPSEATDAVDYGADYIKLFPVSNLGPSYVKAVRAPLSNIKFLAVGGIDENNMADYLKVGVCGFGIGTNIVNQKMIDAGDFASITELAKKYVEVIEKETK